MDNIELLLKNKGLSKTAFSELLGIKKQNLNALMKNPTFETMKRMASALGVPVSELFAPPSGAFTAFVEYRGQIYKARTLGELEVIVEKIKSEEPNK